MLKKAFLLFKLIRNDPMKKIYLMTLIVAFCAKMFSQSAYIQVASEPGISVFLDELFKGKTTIEMGGLIIEDVSEGYHKIKVVKEGFNPQEETLNLKKGEVYRYIVRPFIPAIKITEQGNIGQQQIDIQVGIIKIQSLPVEITISIPKLGVNYAKMKDEWKASEVAVGDYLASFTWHNKRIDYTIVVENEKITHLLVNMIKGEVEDRSVIVRSVTSEQLKPISSNSSDLTVTDTDGNVYDIIPLGTQIWMKENLRTTHYRDGSSINSNGTAGLYYLRDDKIENRTYGLAYDCFAVQDLRNLCPVGWHVSKESDWIILENYFGGSKSAGDKVKTNGTSEFSGQFGGYRWKDGWYSVGLQGGWWTSDGTYRMIDARYHKLYRLVVGTNKYSGMSVRCVKD
jgi:uncharacterized protein (TIGR02145 family)